MTIPTQLVLQVLLDEPEQERYGFEIAEASGLRSGTVHPILARLEGMGWVQSRWEDIDPRQAGRPARRYYLLSAEGAPRARHALQQAHTPVRQLRPLNPTASPDHG
jgi:DNA-binding PadR family transcriptional regulator